MGLTHFIYSINKMNFQFNLLPIFIVFILTSTLLCQTRGAEYRTLDSYAYGRFEASVKPAQGDGITSSFFTYDDSADPWGEIDYEWLGLFDHTIDLNTITTGQASHIRQHYVSF
jgi:beta-glucanase (GH16 family)